MREEAKNFTSLKHLVIYFDGQLPERAGSHENSGHPRDKPKTIIRANLAGCFSILQGSNPARELRLGWNKQPTTQGVKEEEGGRASEAGSMTQSKAGQR